MANKSSVALSQDLSLILGSVSFVEVTWQDWNICKRTLMITDALLDKRFLISHRHLVSNLIYLKHVNLDDVCSNNIFNWGTVSCGSHWAASCAECTCPLPDHAFRWRRRLGRLSAKCKLVTFPLTLTLICLHFIQTKWHQIAVLNKDDPKYKKLRVQSVKKSQNLHSCNT